MVDSCSRSIRPISASVSRSSSQGRDSYDLTPFIATRPLTSAALVSAKLKVTIGSTIAAWLLVLIALPLALRLSGASSVVINRLREGIGFPGRPRVVAIVVLGVAALVASTWKQLVQGLYIGMSGREWVLKASVFLTLSFLAIIWPVAKWIVGNRDAVAGLWNAFPWIVAVLVCFKLSAAAWIAVRLRDRQLLSDRTLVIGAACWDVSVFALYGIFVWLVPTLIVRSYFLVLVAILEVPLARLSAAPLALAWNRHR